ncbi:hypothetical protein AGOR_G00074850 [Albula goreensis]|uniref:J domain-containing protein n=1 Tax=Albula goreensis TaxID=1534307 RepID=A0A8T3DVF8_9TELE|nr:hypothetical protein AGOR_G00074850 [Albula goreensis]
MPLYPIMQLVTHVRQCQRCLSCYRCGLRLFSLSAVYRSRENYYELLGVKPDASSEQIKHAFFNKSKKLHPDSDPNNPDLHSQFVALSEAYRVLIREGSRREYDQLLKYPYHGRQAFRTDSSHAYRPSHSAESAERMRYWEQFRYGSSQDFSAEQWEQKKKRNLYLVGYCLAGMLASMVVHYFGFRKLTEIHNNFMDEKFRTITEIYNESKERARVNGFKKQTEILRQKHAEFIEKYNLRNGRSDK